MIQSQRKKSSSLLIKDSPLKMKSTEMIDRKKSIKEIIFRQKNVKDYEILNNNIKRKISLLQKFIPSNKQRDIMTNTKSNNFSIKQKGYNTERLRQKQEQKYSKQQISIMNCYKNKINQKYKSQIGNPFQMALVEMIQREEQMIKKREKDMLFWQKKVQMLENKYNRLNMKQKQQIDS